jgi:hypothetical protein
MYVCVLLKVTPIRRTLHEVINRRLTARGLQVAAPTRNLQNIEDKLVEKPAKDVRHVPHPRVVSVEPRWLETADLKKCMYMQYVLCNVTERIV